MDRLVGRSVRDLAEEVDAALGRLAFARGTREAAQQALDLADGDVRQAMLDLEAARDALFNDHPDLAPKGWGTPTNQEQTMSQPTLPFDPGPGLDPSKFDPIPIEVDDPNDSRFTAGMSTVPTDDDEPLPDLVWGEHDA